MTVQQAAPPDFAPPHENEQPPIPIVTYGMLFTISLVFLAMYVLGHGNIDSVAERFGAKDSALIRQGQWWRFITPIFLHGSVLHLLTNGFSLYWLGSQIERIYGSRKYFLIYMLSGIAGNLLSFLLSPAPSLGASGALFGLIGAGIVFPLRYRSLVLPEARSRIVKQLVMVAAINLFISWEIPSIDKWAHVGGMIGGGIAALFLLPEVLQDKEPTAGSRKLLNAATWAMAALVLFCAAEQWRAAQKPFFVLHLTSYPLGVKDPWWSYQVPASWKPQRTSKPGYTWLVPDKSELHIIDSSQVPDIGDAAARWLKAHNVDSTPLLIDTKTGYSAVVREGATVTEICQIVAYTRTINIALRCPAAVYPEHHRDFAVMLSLIRFVHPPDDVLLTSPVSP